jgi:hypothetical protein
MITDLKYALRMLMKAPVFAVIAIVTLALGIGANSAIFSVIDTVLLRPLSFPSPEQIVMIWSNNLKSELTAVIHRRFRTSTITANRVAALWQWRPTPARAQC